MLQNANFLCEIGTEEIPAGYIPPAIESVKRIFSSSFHDNRIDYEEIDVYATPRRIAVMAAGLAHAQREEEAEYKGPAAKAAYDQEGNPTKALQGFMKGNGVSSEDIFTRETDKGAYVFARKKLQSRKTEDIIPEIIQTAVSTMPFPKKMKWSDKDISFPRPIRYFLILFNDTHIPFEVDGIAASNMTRGHYIQHNTMVPITKIADYEKILNKHGVIVNHEERRALIRKKLTEAAAQCSGRVPEDEDLLDTVTFLVENPCVALCGFDESFLDIPDVALIAEMKEHQKYFPIVDRNSKLLNNFLVVSNNPVNDNVIEGNKRVVTARFDDASFFFTEDRRQKLIDRVEGLKNVLFHKELGSIYDKLQRMEDVAKQVTNQLRIEKTVSEKINRAILLSKADLETAMVYEFSSLQGQMGKIYALLDGEEPDVAEAIEEHYKPRFQGDELPSGTVSMVTSLAEKIDNIFGSFSVGNIPKGSQDPYALRRQANAIIEMLLQKEINLSLEKVLRGVAQNYKDGETLVDKILDFISARVKTIFSERGMNYDEIDACLSIKNTDYLELYRRAVSIHDFRKDDKFTQLLLSFKRMNNIVSAFKKENKGYTLVFNETLMQKESEKALYDFFSSRSDSIRRYIERSEYIELFKLIIEGKTIIDEFFDDVLVMDDDTKIRDNRLALLERILENFTSLLDFSKISDK